MSRHGFHCFTIAAPVFEFDDFDPFYEAHPVDRATPQNSRCESRAPLCMAPEEKETAQ
jgi:hypothetical protein